MEVNRVLVYHAIRRENRQELQKLHYLMVALKRAGLEILIDRDDDSAEFFFPQLQQKLLTCQAFILLQTPDAVSAPRVRLAVRAAGRLAKQKRIQAFRFISPPKTETVAPEEWKVLTTFDGTDDYQRTCEELVSAIGANSPKQKTTRAVATRDATSALPRISPLKTPSLVSCERLQILPSQTSSARPQIRPSVEVESSPRTTIEASPGSERGPIPTATPAQTMTVLQPLGESHREQTNLFSPPSLETHSIVKSFPSKGQKPSMREKFLLQRRKNTDTDKTRGARNILMLTFITLVMFLIIGSAGTVFFLSGSKLTSPTPNSIVGQVFFIGSDQIGSNYNTGICDEIQVNLNHLNPPTEGKSYYAWLLPDTGPSEGSPATFLDRLTVNNGAASMTYANPTHENLLLTKSRFLITQESTSTPPSIPSPDQHIWRYSAALSQIPNSQDPHYSYLDHIRHLLAQDPTIQKLGMQGGLSTWFYQNVKSVLGWANLAQGAGNAGNFRVVRNNAISLLDYLDGTEFVAKDVPPGTPIVADPQISRVPILSLSPDTANQNPLGYIQAIEHHLQGLTDSLGVTDAQRTLASKIVHELDVINGHLEQVRQDAKQLANMSDTSSVTPATASLLTDLVANANRAFVGQLDAGTNTRQGGTTWVHDVLPQLATLNVKEVS